MRLLWENKKHNFILLFILLLGLILRLWNIKQDLPYNYYGDESYLIYLSLKFGTGDLNPHWFIWPTFFQYTLFFLFSIFYLLGKIFGWFKNTTDFLYLYLKDPSIFFLIGRITSAFLGTASIYLIYLLSKKIYNKKIALLSSLLFAFLPLPVEYSHYAVVDTALVFMLLLAFIFIVNIFLYNKKKDYLLSGLFIGVATATKYPAIFWVISIFLAHLFKNNKKEGFKFLFNKNIFLCIIGIFLGFFLTCPFAILDFPKFILDIKGQILCAKIGWFGWEKTNPYLEHLFNLISAMGFTLFLFFLLSIFYIIIKKQKDCLIFLIPTIIYFLILGLNKNTYSRFVLPILPLLVIFSSKFLYDLKIKFNKMNLLWYLMVLFLLSEPLYLSIKTDLNFSLPNTMTQAKEWVEKNIPSGSKILLNEYGPALMQSPYKIRLQAQKKPKDLLTYGYHKKREIFYQIKEKVAKEKINYDLSYIINPIGYLEGEPNYERDISESIEAIKNYKEKYDLIIISDALLYKFFHYPKELIPKKYWPIIDFYKEIMYNYKPIKEFLSLKNKTKGPNIRIYKLR